MGMAGCTWCARSNRGWPTPLSASHENCMPMCTLIEPGTTSVLRTGPPSKYKRCRIVIGFSLSLVIAVQIEKWEMSYFRIISGGTLHKLIPQMCTSAKHHSWIVWESVNISLWPFFQRGIRGQRLVPNIMCNFTRVSCALAERGYYNSSAYNLKYSFAFLCFLTKFYYARESRG